MTASRASCDDRRIGRGLLILIALLAASLPFAPAASADPAATRVVKVLGWETKSRVTEKPPAGVAGDVVTGSDRLRNAVAQFGKPKGAVVGRDTYRIVVHSTTRATIHVTTTLPGGTVRCRGTARADRPGIVIALVGGTGQYAGASGTCAATQPAPAMCVHPDERSRICELNTYRIRT